MATPPPIARQASKVETEFEMLPVEMGKQIWVPSNETVWDLGTVMAIGELKVTVRTAAGKVQQVDRGLALPLNPRITDDMTALYYIHEAGVMHNLSERSKLEGPDGNGQRPYTFMANVLIAVNPLRDLPNPSIRDVVSNPGTLPHPYSIAEMAYQQMVYNSGTDQPTNQSVVISGESGAGKTESSKIVLKHLTTRGLYGKKARGEELEKLARERKEVGTSLDHRLIEQNPILEAFGNAKTLRNHNSSRFGKFMKLQFTSNGEFKLAGAFVETYLLEKSRLVYQVDGERNFHVFYQLLAGASSALKSQFKLTKPQDYRYLNQSNCYVAEDTDDAKCYQAVVRGLTCVGISDQNQNTIFSIVAGLLHMGNIEFDEEDTPEGEAAIVQKPTAKEALVNAAKMLGVSEQSLLKVITEREIVTRDETFTVRRNAQNAIYARDAIAKALYGRMFDWIILQVNVSLGQDPAPLPYIGVLDIFGFESFQRNDFEQLLINYTNEVLQATFNNQVFIAEMELYKREGITVGKIKWPDNRECVELIASRPDGILAILDAEAMNPKPSDEKFLAMLHRKHNKNPYFPRPHPKDMQQMFIVRHFAGCVTYTVGAFIDKNNDTIPKDMADLFLSSSNQLTKAFFKDDDEGKGNRRVLKSVSAKFAKQMQDLVETLDATRCNFIRCIKPNALMRMGMFDPRYVIGQLRCQGIMQTAQVLKVGLPTRVSYHELVGAYKKFMPPDAQRLFSNQSDPTLITAILWAFQVPMDAYKLGITKLFFKAGKIALLDSILKINWAVDGPRIVSRMKLWLARRRWRVALAKVLSQIAWKKLLKKIQFRVDAVRHVQQWWRGLRARRRFKKTKYAVITIQKVFRGFRARVFYKAEKQRMIALAAARAEEARRQAEEAKRKEEAARRAAEEARAESLRRAAEEEERQRIEEEARAAEEEAMRLAQEAAAAVREAEAAAAEAAAAVEHERQAELKAIAEARELEERLAREREEAEKRKEAALLRAASVSANLLGGLAQVTTREGAAGEVTMVDIPEDLPQENKEQLHQLNDLLLSGAIAQEEYDELVPFLLEKPVEEPTGAALSAEQEESLSRLYSAGVYGIQIRCPACGSSNNTANGNHCEACGSLLTTSSQEGNYFDHSYYGYRARSMSRQYSSSITHLSAPLGSFSKDGQRILIHDGYFQCQMHGTQVLQDENYAEYTVYVLRCGWQPKDSDKCTYWLVSHRFSVFERLHKDLKHKIPPNVAVLPSFPRKHVLSGVFAGKTGNSAEIVEERKRGLESYLSQVLDICAHLPSTLNVPELDRFLNLSRQVEQIRRQQASAADEGGMGGPPQSGGGFNMHAGGAEALAAREQARLPTELPTPLDEDELTQTEQAVAMLNNAIRNSRGDLRRDQEVQHLLKVCVQLLPRLQISANLDNPFANVDLIPRAMQCQEDLETTMGLYNDSLLAVTETYAMSAEGQGHTPAPYVPGQQNSYQRSYGV